MSWHTVIIPAHSKLQAILTSEWNLCLRKRALFSQQGWMAVLHACVVHAAYWNPDSLPVSSCTEMGRTASSLTSYTFWGQSPGLLLLVVGKVTSCLSWENQMTGCWKDMNTTSCETIRSTTSRCHTIWLECHINTHTHKIYECQVGFFFLCNLFNPSHWPGACD